MEGFANLQAARPGALEVFRRVAATAGVRIVYSTDANAGSHGANTDELIAYVEQGRQDPMDAVVSATSLAAESVGLADRIGAVAAGYQVDVIALDGDPSPTRPPWAASSSSCAVVGSTRTTHCDRRLPIAEAVMQ